jgi:hypothetical protein
MTEPCQVALFALPPQDSLLWVAFKLAVLAFATWHVMLSDVTCSM